MSTPTPERIRLTISVTPEVHASFKRLADASNMPIGRAMGEWLGDTIEAVEFTAQKVQEARAAPRLVMQEMHAYALGVADEATAVLAGMRAKERSARKAQPSRSASASPPSSNTGGKVPPKPKAKRQVRRSHG